jgi:hypothetical protein
MRGERRPQTKAGDPLSAARIISAGILRAIRDYEIRLVFEKSALSAPLHEFSLVIRHKESFVHFSLYQSPLAFVDDDASPAIRR